jgi:DNA polymerase-3 subunit gamma/tau
MSYQVLARKYRPQKFSDVIGQDHVTRTLQNAIEQQRIAHGYIFSGHRGIGKTTIARILAMSLNCRSTDHPVAEPCGVCDSCVEIRQGNAVDVIEIDAATNRGIDEIRELREAARYRPARDRFKVWILDEAHQITDAAFNALLKTLEEPPSHVIFMMATTQPEDIPQTIRSRCQHFSFHAVRFDEIIKQLRSIATSEGIEADDNALSLLAEAGDGSMRDALSIMDQAIACTTGRLTAADVRGLVGAVSSDILEDMMSAVERNSSEDVLTLVDRLMIEGHNPAHFARQMVRFLRNTIVAKVAGKDSSLLQISTDESERVARAAENFSEEDLTRFLQIMLRTHSELGYKNEQRFHLELGLLKLVHAQRLIPLEQILGNQPLPKPTASAPRTTATATRTPEAPAARSTGVEPPRRPSPFETDMARKRNSNDPPRGTMSTAPAIEGTSAIAVAPAPEPIAQIGELSLPKIQTATLTAMEKSNQKIIAHWMEMGEWTIAGNEVVITVGAKQPMIDAAIKGEAQRVLNQSASEVAGQPVRIKMISGANGNGPPVIAKPASSDGTDARSRALQHPIVKKMKEKFGAEIRTVVDQRNKR